MKEVLEQPSDVHRDLGARERRGGVRGRLRQHRDCALVRPQAACDLEQAVACAGVVGVDGHEPRERLERRGVVAQALVAQLGDTTKEIASLFGRTRRLEADLEHANELGDVVALGVDPLEHRRGAGARRGDVEQLLDEVARFVVGRSVKASVPRRSLIASASSAGAAASLARSNAARRSHRASAA